jgi:HPt (histidine-containing phosphotransfer) domain-containing protein
MYDSTKIDQLRELMDGDLAELTSLVDEYEANAASLISQAREALSGGAARELCRGVHTLKSSSALMGAAGLAKQCEELEHLTRQGQIPPDAAQRVAKIEADFSEAKVWIRQQALR